MAKLNGAQITVEEMLSDPTIYKFYANGFIGGVSINDATIGFLMGDNPVALLNLSQQSLFLLKRQIDGICSLLNEMGINYQNNEKLAEKINELRNNKG